MREIEDNVFCGNLGVERLLSGDCEGRLDCQTTTFKKIEVATDVFGILAILDIENI